jgi:hypothetical protein
VSGVKARLVVAVGDGRRCIVGRRIILWTDAQGRLRWLMRWRSPYEPGWIRQSELPIIGNS